MHFFVAVVISKKKIEECCVDCAVTEALAPYDDLTSRFEEPGFEVPAGWKAPKWDWYGIGGRFMGCLSGYMPEDDPDRQEACPKCKGSGRDEGGSGPCYFCDGKGRVLRWFSLYFKRHDGDVWPVAELLQRSNDKWIPWAVLTPEGEWSEWSGPMEWEADPDLQREWVSKVRNILAAYADHLIVVVDCHQ